MEGRMNIKGCVGKFRLCCWALQLVLVIGNHAVFIGGKAFADTVVVRGSFRDQLGRPAADVECSGIWKVSMTDGTTTDVAIDTAFAGGSYRLETTGNVDKLLVRFHKQGYELAGATIDVAKSPKDVGGNPDIVRDFILWDKHFRKLPRLERNTCMIGCLGDGWMDSVQLTTGTHATRVFARGGNETWLSCQFPFGDSVTTPGVIVMDVLSVKPEPTTCSASVSEDGRVHEVPPPDKRVVLRLVGASSGEGFRGAGVVKLDDWPDALSVRALAPDELYDERLEVPCELFSDYRQSALLFYVRYKGMYGKGLVHSTEYKEGIGPRCILSLFVNPSGSRELLTKPEPYSW